MKWNRAAFGEKMAQRFGRERWNEHVKLLATALNGVGIASLIGAFVAPWVNSAPQRDGAIPTLVLVGLTLHLVAHEVLRYYRSKE